MCLHLQWPSSPPHCQPWKCQTLPVTISGNQQTATVLSARSEGGRDEKISKSKFWAQSGTSQNLVDPASSFSQPLSNASLMRAEVLHPWKETMVTEVTDCKKESELLKPAELVRSGVSKKIDYLRVQSRPQRLAGMSLRLHLHRPVDRTEHDLLMCAGPVHRSSASLPMKSPSRDRQSGTPRFGPRSLKLFSCLGLMWKGTLQWADSFSESSTLRQDTSLRHPAG